MLIMTTRGNPVAREKDHTSYHALFRDLEGCGSYLRDIEYRTPEGGWLIKSNLNLLPCGIGDLLMTKTTKGGRRGGGAR